MDAKVKKPECPKTWKFPVKVNRAYMFPTRYRGYVVSDSSGSLISVDLSVKESRALAYALNKVYGRRK